MATNAPAFMKEFHLDPHILGPNSAGTVAVSATTDAGVLAALLADKPFPVRPGGKIALGSIMLQAQGASQVTFNAGQGSVSFDFSAGFHTGLGIFDQPADAIGSLQVNAPENLDLTLASDPTSRYLLMLWGYKAAGSFSGSHPIGALGTVTFGAQADGASVYAVIHRFPGATGASTAIADTVHSWRLPRHVAKADDLKPGTWVLAQADGSLAIKVAAQLGYSFDFVRQANLLGITRELGAKIDAGVQATFGFSASGRYLVILGRESEGPSVRLRLYKQSDQGFNFGLNLTVGVQEKGELPANIDEFVQAVFGVHGLQVVKDLHLIKDWTDPTKDLGETAARLLNDTGLDLLTKASGIDARLEFEKARQLVLNGFAQWDALPGRASTAVWGILGKLNGPDQRIPDLSHRPGRSESAVARQCHRAGARAGHVRRHSPGQISGGDCRSGSACLKQPARPRAAGGFPDVERAEWRNHQAGAGFHQPEARSEHRAQRSHAERFRQARWLAGEAPG